MIFTRRFGALAARPTFERIASQDDLDRELHDLLNDADLEPAANGRPLGQPLELRGQRRQAQRSSI